MNIYLETRLKWSQLDDLSVQSGLHPDDLGRLNLDLAEDQLTSKTIGNLKVFFIASRCATSDTDFELKTRHIIENPSVSIKIKFIIQCILNLSDSEKNIEKNPNNYLSDSPIENLHHPNEKNEYYQKFAYIYNFLLYENKAYLMHSRRKAELINEIRHLYPGQDYINHFDLAEQLILFRNHGYAGMKIIKLESFLTTLKTTKKSLLDDINKKMQGEALSNALKLKMEQQSTSNAPKLEAGEECRPNDMKLKSSKKDSFLEKKELLYFSNKMIREVVLKTHDHVLKTNQLKIFDYPIRQQGVHELERIVKKEVRVEAPRGDLFVDVYCLLEKLKDCTTEELEREALLSDICSINDQIEKVKKYVFSHYSKELNNQIELINKQAKDFEFGDFSFLEDRCLREQLTKIYERISNRTSTFAKAINDLEKLKQESEGVCFVFMDRWISKCYEHDWNWCVEDYLKKTKNILPVGYFLYLQAILIEKFSKIKDIEVAYESLSANQSV